jgi:hypothetical protein
MGVPDALPYSQNARCLPFFNASSLQSSIEFQLFGQSRLEENPLSRERFAL